MTRKLQAAQTMKKSPKKLPDTIIRAICRNDFDAVNKWQSPEEIDFIDKDQRTAVFHAVLNNSKDMFSQLLKSNPDLNLKDSRGWSLLHYAVQQKSVYIAELLVNKSVDLEMKDDYGNTPLWRATFSSNGKGEMITFLLSKGADPNNMNNSDISPMKLADTIANYDVKQFF